MKVYVTDYCPNWPARYQAEAEQIKQILADNLLAIYHIGSTSVPGLAAKPIIDILVSVKDISGVDGCNVKFQQIGYECMGEFGIAGRRYFRKGGDNRTHQIHIFDVTNQKDIERHLAFRDYLRAHKEEAAAYGKLKTALALQYPEDIESYCDGKDAFVKELEAKARRWYQCS